MTAVVVALLQVSERALLGILHALGLAPVAHGQPAWPFAERVAIETLAIDGGLTRRVAITIAGILVALTITLIAAVWRKGRWPLLAAALAILVLLPWPSTRLVLATAYPTSFHRSPSGFEVTSIERGLTLFESQCASCHGDDGRGEGPRAASLPMWPPRLSSALLWRRAEGEVFWHILDGMRDGHGAETMPGFVGRLDDREVWALIDAMKVIAGGSSVREDDAWAEPVRAPDARVRCDGRKGDRRLSDFRGQRLRLVAAGGSYTRPREDPRLVTIALLPDGEAPPEACAIADAAAYAVFAQVSGNTVSDFNGAQLIVDRDGWLRAYARPGQSEWSQDDLLCGAHDVSRPRSSAVDGLGDLIAAIDADPVRSAALGLAHGR